MPHTHSVHAYDSFRRDIPWQAAQYICMLCDEKLGEESERPRDSIWKLSPLSPLSTDGNGSGTSGRYDGGVRACWRGEAWYPWKCEAENGGNDARLTDMGEGGT
jgi:hypothetical protein